jgi:dGTPase
MVNLNNIIAGNSQSRLIKEKSTDLDYRSEYLHDRDRILFSRSFRRLAGKTQVVTVSGLKTSDHIRSRLTHSLEVMQIASSIGNYITKIRPDTDTDYINIDLIEAISLGHDLGHTPYGHVGERSLCDFLKKDEC